MNVNTAVWFLSGSLQPPWPQRGNNIVVKSGCVTVPSPLSLPESCVCQSRDPKLLSLQPRALQKELTLVLLRAIGGLQAQDFQSFLQAIWQGGKNVHRRWWEEVCVGSLNTVGGFKHTGKHLQSYLSSWLDRDSQTKKRIKYSENTDFHQFSVSNVGCRICWSCSFDHPAWSSLPHWTVNFVASFLNKSTNTLTHPPDTHSWCSLHRGSSGGYPRTAALL